MRYSLLTVLLLLTLMLEACGDPKKTVTKAIEEYVTEVTNAPECNCYSDDVDLDALMELPKGGRGNDTLLIHCGHIVNYHQTWRLPDWVAYALTREETYGQEERGNNFNADPLLSRYPVQWYDYKKSGYDRGHMAPAGDMKWSEVAMEESFYMTNICPQDQELNRGRWNDLENLVRKWARQDSVVYVVCGPVVEDGCKKIGEHHDIAVPKGFFKVVLRQHREKYQPTPQWQAIAFYFDNVNTMEDLCTFAMSVDKIEQMTGLDFFPNLPDEVENVIEAVCDPAAWGLRPKRQ